MHELFRIIFVTFKLPPVYVVVMKELLVAGRISEILKLYALLYTLIMQKPRDKLWLVVYLPDVA